MAGHSTDYIIASWKEGDLFLLEHDPMRHFDMPIPPSVPDRLVSPLVASDGTFESRRDSWGLDVEAARLLDDVRFLTLSITSQAAGSANDTKKVLTTASWLHGRIAASPSRCVAVAGPDDDDDDVIHDVIRTAALVYTWSIMTRTPLSRYVDAAACDELRSRWAAVDIERWKAMMGISQWVLLVACPGSGAGRKGKFIRRKMGVSGMSIGMEAFPLSIAYCKAFWRVQRWMAGDEGGPGQIEASAGTASSQPD